MAVEVEQTSLAVMEVHGLVLVMVPVEEVAEGPHDAEAGLQHVVLVQIFLFEAFSIV